MKLLALLALLLLTGCTVHAYGGPPALNSGIYWDTSPGHCAGIEFTGHPGYFVDVDCT
jgi:outer membrane biogenesis lipoprotein LolB